VAKIELESISKRFGGLEIIPNLSLAIDDGEFIVIVGPSGCGKSTLLRMIAGLETISGGDLTIGGRRVNELPSQKRNIAMVFQTYALFPHLTVAQNIAFGPEVRGETASAIDKKVKRAAAVLNLTPYLKRRPSELSGGQRQRVAMGRAIVRHPDVFLFDEPLSNLDAHLRVEMRTEIKALHRNLGSTIVYVTHDQIEAMTMADRIVIMNGGHIEQVGSPIELYDRPINRFVAGFLGSPSMSFLDAQLAQDGSKASVLLSDGCRIPVSRRSTTADDIVIGIRPECFTLDKNASIQISVEVVEPTGSEVFVYGRVAGQPIRAVFPGRPAVEVGRSLRVGVLPQDVHVFDRRTGVRLPEC
jgi:multiple sugar transport system ATP-binding protein